MKKNLIRTLSIFSCIILSTTIFTGIPLTQHPTTAETTTIGQPGFDGYLTENTDLTYAGARNYDPKTGCFDSIDPLNSLTGPYGYCNGNPITLRDSTGLDPQPYRGPVMCPYLTGGGFSWWDLNNPWGPLGPPPGSMPKLQADALQSQLADLTDLLLGLLPLVNNIVQGENKFLTQDQVDLLKRYMTEIRDEVNLIRQSGRIDQNSFDLLRTVYYKLLDVRVYNVNLKILCDRQNFENLYVACKGYTNGFVESYCRNIMSYLYVASTYFRRPSSGFATPGGLTTLAGFAGTFIICDFYATWLARTNPPVPDLTNSGLNYYGWHYGYP